MINFINRPNPGAALAAVAAPANDQQIVAAALDIKPRTQVVHGDANAVDAAFDEASLNEIELNIAPMKPIFDHNDFDVDGDEMDDETLESLI